MRALIARPFAAVSTSRPAVTPLVCSTLLSFEGASSRSVTTQRRCKAYVMKFLRGQLPADLKDVQGAIGCLYGSLPDVDEYGGFVAQPDQISQFNQVGYLKLPRPILDAQQVDKLADEVNELANNKEHHPKTEYLYATSLADLTGGPLFFCQGQWRASWGLHDLVYMPSITVVASQLLGNSPVRLWYDEVFMKTARKGPCIPWQQNYMRWQHTTPVNHVTAMVALDTLNKDRGAPCLIPGSHRWRGGEVLPGVEYDPTKDEASQMNTIWEVVDDDEREMLMDIPPQTIDMKRGDVMFLHPLTLYATHGNRTLDDARFVFLHFFGKDLTTVNDGPLLPHTTNFAAGSKVSGPYFPMVFDPALSEELTSLPHHQESE